MHVTRNQVQISADLPNADLLVLNSKRGSRSGLETRHVRGAKIALLTCIRIKGKLSRDKDREDVLALIRYTGIYLPNKIK